MRCGPLGSGRRAKTEAMLGFERLGPPPRSDEYCWREQTLWRKWRRLRLVRRCGERTKPDSIITSISRFSYVFFGLFAVLLCVGGVLLFGLIDDGAWGRCSSGEIGIGKLVLSVYYSCTLPGFLAFRFQD